MKNICVFVCIFLFSIFAAFDAAAYPSSVKFDIQLYQTPDQVVMPPGDRFVLVRSKSAGLLRFVDMLGFEPSSTITVGNGLSPLGTCFASTAKKVVVVTGEGSILSYSAEDPTDPGDEEEIEVAEDAAYEDIRCAALQSKDYIYLWNTSDHSITIYNLTDSSKGSELSFDDDVVDYRIDEDLGLLFVLKKTGLLYVYDAVSGTYYTYIDLSNIYSTTMDLIGMKTAAVSGYGYVVLAVNDSDPGEIYIINVTSAVSGSIFAVDADSSDGVDIDPVTVSAHPSALGVGTVKNPEDGGGDTSYAAVISSSGTLQWFDLGDLVDKDKVSVFGDTDTSSSVPFDGIAFSSAADGYMYVADTSSTRFRVFTSNPLVTIVSYPSPSTIGSGEDTTFTFSSDTDGTYKVRLDGFDEPYSTISSDDGGDVGSGDIEAGEEVTVSVGSSLSLEEGEHTLTVFVKDSDGNTGRESVTFSYDLPPGKVDAFGVFFGDQKIIVRWRSLDSSDIDYYNVYFGTSAADFSGAAGISSPVQVDHPGESKDMEYIIEPVPNGTTVFVKITAVDEAGNEGDATDVKSATAEGTYGIISSSGETGGCGTAGRTAHLWKLLILLIPILLIKKRSKKTVLFFVMLIMFSFNAFAGENRRYSVDLMYRFYIPQDRVLHRFLGDLGNDLFTFRASVFVWKGLSVGVDTGFLREHTAAKGVSSGAKSGEKITFTMVPINYVLEYRFDGFPVQWLTPCVSTAFGTAYYDVTEQSGSVSGMKFSIRPGAALLLRLDKATREIHSTEELLGLKSFYLRSDVIYSAQIGDGLDLSAWEIGIGIGMEF